MNYCDETNATKEFSILKLKYSCKNLLTVKCSFKKANFSNVIMKPFLGFSFQFI